MAKRAAPENCYWRGAAGREVLWGRIEVRGQEYRWSLRTRDGATASRRVEQRRQELEAAAHYGESRRSYDQAVAEWTAHILGQVGPKTAKRYAVSLKAMEGFLRPLFVDQISR